MWAIVKSLVVSLVADIVRDWWRDRSLRKLGYTEAQRDQAKRANQNRRARQEADRDALSGNAGKRLRDRWSRD